MRRSVLSASIVAMLVILGSRSASAAPPDPGATMTFRLSLPLMGMWSNEWPSTPERLGARVQLGAASASVRFLQLAELALEGRYWVDPCVHGPSVSPRIGISPSVVDTRAAGSGWDLSIPVLAGYSYFWLTGGGCDLNPDERAHALTLAAGIEAIAWKPTWGFAMRLLPFLGHEWNHTVASGGSREERSESIAYGITADFGLALPVPP